MKNIIPIMLALILFSCGGEGANYDADTSYDLAMEAAPMASRSEKQVIQPAQERSKKVIKTGNIHFRSDDLAEDRKAINSILPDFDAYIENEGESRNDGSIHANMTLRVPADKYDSLYNTLSGMADHLESRSSNIQDATERYYDLESRIHSKKALEERYLELLKQAGQMRDVLEIERSLNQVRTEIEQLQGQFNYLDKQISLSTIYLSFYEQLPFNYEPGNQKGFFAKILQALDNGWQGFLVFLVGLFTLWPFILIGLFIIYLVLRMRKKRRAGN